MYVYMYIEFETGSGHLGHVLSWSSESDLVYKISESVSDSALDPMCVDNSICCDQSNELSVLDSYDGSIPPDSPQVIRKD